MRGGPGDKQSTGAIYPAFAMDMRVVGKDDGGALAVHPLHMLTIDAEPRDMAADVCCGDVSWDPGLLVRVDALFSAIASDSFFELMASHNLTLSSPGGSESDLSSVGSPNSISHASYDLVALDVDVNRYVDSFGKTLLHHACRVGNVQVARCLLFHGASASSQCPHGRTPFHDAVSACSEHTLALLQLLYEHEPAGMTVVDVNGGHVLHLAAIHGCLDVIQWCASLRQGSSSDKELSLAITSFGGRNVLHYAAYNGRLEVLQWLLGGVDNDRVDEFDVGAMDATGHSLLHFAAMGSHLDVCQWLVLDAPGRKNVAINARNCEGKRAIDLAKHEVVKQFLAVVGRIPSPPSALKCIGADHCSLGITWTIEQDDDERLRAVLAPTQLSIEYCRRPTGVSYTAGASVLAMLMAAARSQSLLRWEHVDLAIPSTATEYWLPGLEEASEYLVRMRAMNRNGYSEYAYPRVSGGFSTTGHNTTSLPMQLRLARSLHHVSFVGDLRFELLEGRALAALVPSRRRSRASSLPFPAYPLSPRRYTGSTAPDAGQYYCVVSVELPGRGYMSERAATPRRRTAPMSLPTRHDPSPPLSPSSPAWRELYCVQSRPAGVQEAMVCAGSSSAARHPEFGFSTTFRVPDPSLAIVRVEVRCETRRSDICVGVAKLRMLDLVRGLPLKTRWVALEPPAVGLSRSAALNDCGLVLMRTLFLTDGASEAGTHAALASVNLLRHRASYSGASQPVSHSTNQHEGSAFRFHTPQDHVALDEFGFRVVDPKLQFVRGKWQYRDEVTSHKTYACFEQLRVLMDRQQARKWKRLRASLVALDSSSGGESDGDDAAVCSALFSSIVEPLESAATFRQEFRAIAWGGFPSDHRAAIYSQLTMKQRRSYAPDYFASLVDKAARASADDRAQPSDRDDATDLSKAQAGCSDSSRAKFLTAKKQIRADLQRTFAGNQSWINTVEGQQALARVLEAYAVHNAAVGYCQSMTFIVGRLLCLFRHYRHRQESNAVHHHRIHPLPASPGDLLLVTPSKPVDGVEEDAFWVAVVLFDMFPTYFTSGMSGLQADASVLEELVRTRLPQLNRHLNRLQVPHVGLLLASQWLLPVFCAGFPTHTTFRILDVLLHEGSAAIFPVAIALLRISQPELLAEHVDYMHVFRALKARDQRLHDAALLMEVAHDEFQLLSPSTIATLRDHFAV